MNIIFMGTSNFAVPALHAVYNSDHFITAVFTKEPKKSGRGHKTQKSPIHIEAEKLELNILTPKSLKNDNIILAIDEMKPDVIVVTAYGHIIPKSILKIPRFGCINIHPSLLPRWRGASPIERTILAGDKETAVCIMQMDETLDTGDILLMQKIAINNDMTSQILSQKLAELGSHLLIEILSNITNITPQKQLAKGVTYAEKISKEEGSINWQKSATEIDRMIRAFNPWPGCFFCYQNEQIKITKAEVIDESRSGCKPGEVIDKNLTICCGKGLLRPLILQRPGKKLVSGKDFINGMKIKPGTILE